MAKHKATISSRTLEIPTALASILENCTEGDAEEIWSFLDGNPDAPMLMIELVVESHPEMKSKSPYLHN